MKKKEKEVGNQKAKGMFEITEKTWGPIQKGKMLP